MLIIFVRLKNESTYDKDTLTGIYNIARDNAIVNSDIIIEIL